MYDPAVGDPDNGVAPGTAFEDLPDDWACPLCSVGKDQFVPEADIMYVMKKLKKVLLLPMITEGMKSLVEFPATVRLIK